MALIIFLAYAATAIFFVWRDLRERDSAKVVGFVLNYRNGGSPKNLLAAGLSWLPATIIAAYRKPALGRMGREAVTVGFFVFALILGWIISS